MIAVRVAASFDCNVSLAFMTEEGQRVVATSTLATGKSQHIEIFFCQTSYSIKYSV